MSVDTLEKEIRCILIPMRESWLLLPNAVVAEVLNVPEYKLIDNSEDWLMGELNWREQRVPLVQLDLLLRTPVEQHISKQSKVVILNAISGNTKVPYFAIISQLIPRLIKVSESTLKDIPTPKKAKHVSKWTRVNDYMALIPDLESIERTVYKGYVGVKT